MLENAEADSTSVSEDEIEKVKGRRAHREGPSERKINLEDGWGQESGLGPNGGVAGDAESHRHSHGHPH